MELPQKTQEFLQRLDEEDLAELDEIITTRKHRKWIFKNAHYLVKGTVFLIASWMAFETFLKHIFIKLFH